MSAPVLTPADHALLERRVRALAPIPDDEWRGFLSGVTVQQLDTGDPFLRAGEPARWFALVSQGLVREYYATADGDEFTWTFCAPGSATGSLFDLLSGAPAITSIQALEPTRLLRVSYANFNDGCTRFPPWHEVARRHAEALFVLEVRREHELLTLPARQRSAALRDRMGELEARIPQRHIASHLGITPEHLSRVRHDWSSDRGILTTPEARSIAPPVVSVRLGQRTSASWTTRAGPSSGPCPSRCAVARRRRGRRAGACAG